MVLVVEGARSAHKQLLLNKFSLVQNCTPKTLTFLHYIPPLSRYNPNFQESERGSETVRESRRNDAVSARFEEFLVGRLVVLPPRSYLLYYFGLKRLLTPRKLPQASAKF